MGRFSEAIESEVLLFDGSMGALIGQMGYKTACPDEMATTNKDVIRQIHERYLSAGANVLISDTFGATEMALRHKGKSGMGETFTQNAVALAKEVAGEKALVAVDMGPTSEFVYPIGTYKTEDFFETFLNQAKAGKEAGGDFALIETQTDAAECRAACLAARKAGLEAAASFTFEKGRTLMGSSPECCALILEAAGAKALGINCSTGPDQMLDILMAIKRVSNLPVIVQPNAGLPQTAPDGGVFYPFTPEEMFESMKKIAEAGADALGGCCGTTPDHIRMLKPLTGKREKRKTREIPDYVCSSRVYVPLSEAVKSMEEISDPDDIMDVDDEETLVLFDLTGLSPEEAADAVYQCTSLSRNPIAFRADNRETLECALFVYAGVAAVEKNEEFADIIAYYGAKEI